MTLFLILLPFATFAGLMLVASPAVSVFAAAAVAAAIVLRDLMTGRSVKMLSAGTAIVFAAIGGYATLVDRHVDPLSVRLAVDAGMLAISLLSLAIREPFTIQYAREVVDAETALRPTFRRVNYILTWAWTAALVVMLATSMLMIYAPSLPLWVGAGMAFAARYGAALFTRWYPEQHRAKMARETTAA